MLLMCQLSAHLYAEGPPLYCSQFDRKTHTIVPIQHVDVSTVSLSVCRRCTFEMLPLCFRREESIQIDMSTFPYAVDVSTVSSFVCRRSTFVLLPVWLEDTHNCPNATFWCVNWQLICMQKVHLWNVAILLHIWREHRTGQDILFVLSVVNEQ